MASIDSLLAVLPDLTRKQARKLMLDASDSVELAVSMHLSAAASAAGPGYTKLQRLRGLLGGALAPEQLELLLSHNSNNVQKAADAFFSGAAAEYLSEAAEPLGARQRALGSQQRHRRAPLTARLAHPPPTHPPPDHRGRPGRGRGRGR
jgi:hypothetical protein